MTARPTGARPASTAPAAPESPGTARTAAPGALRSGFLAVVLVAMFAVALQPALRLYHGALAWQALCGAAALAAAVSWALRRAPASLVAPVSLTLLGAYTLMIVWLSARQAHVPGGVTGLAGDALRGGVARLLGTLLPLEAQPDTLALPVIAVWVAALAATELAARSGRTLASYAGPTAVYVAAWVFAGPHAGVAWWRPVAFVVLALAGLTGVTRARSLAATAAVAAASLACAPVIGASVTAGPADFHTVTPPRDRTLDESPLIRLSGWNLDGKAPLFHVDVTGAKPGATVRLRLAVLPSYDGVTWRVDSRYRPAGTVLAPGAGRVAAHIDIEDLDGHLLPAPENPKTISGVRVAIDQSTGGLMRPEGLAPGLSYTVVAAPEPVDSEAASVDNVPSGPAVARYLALPGTPPELMLRLAQQIGAESSTPYERADGIAEFLRDHYRMVSDAPSGHAYPNLSFFLFSARNLGGQRGTSEQFAAAFAVLGRMMGLPTRVVVGFDATAPSSTVRGADAIAWPEVLFDGVGWVPFNPFPTTDEPLRKVEDDFAAKVTPPSKAPTEAPAPSLSPPSPSASASSAAPIAVSSSRVNWAWPAAVAGVMLVAALVVAVVQRRHERRRWTTGPPAKRVAHAWWAVHRSLRKAGHRAPDHLDASQVATHAARFADAPLGELVAAVNATAFGGVELTEGEVSAAQAQARAYLAAVKSRPRS